MNILINYILPVLILSFAAEGQQLSIKADQDSNSAEQLRELEFKMNKLLLERDLTVYATYLADDYIRISANGRMQNKEQVLQEFRTSQPGEAIPEILQIRIYGNTAVLNIHLTITREDSGKKITRESLLTKVFILQGGRWFMVSNQGTALDLEKSSQ